MCLVKWAPPHGTVVLMSRQHCGEVSEKQRPAQNFLSVFFFYFSWNLFLSWNHMILTLSTDEVINSIQSNCPICLLTSICESFSLDLQIFPNYFSDLSVTSRSNCMFARVFQPAAAVYANIHELLFWPPGRSAVGKSGQVQVHTHSLLGATVRVDWKWIASLCTHLHRHWTPTGPMGLHLLGLIGDATMAVPESELAYFAQVCRTPAVY